jgi:hypothetical protein
MDDDAQTTDPNTGEPPTPDDNPHNPDVPPVFSEEASSVGSSGGLTQEPFPVAEGNQEPASTHDNGGTSDMPDAPGPAKADESTPAEQI